MRSDRKSLRFFLPIPSFFSTFTVQKASFVNEKNQNEVLTKTKMLMTEKEKEYRRERMVRSLTKCNLLTMGCKTTGQVARQLRMTAKELYRELQERDILYKSDGIWMLTPAYAFQNLLRYRYTLYYTLLGEEKVRVYPVWTEKGLKFLTEEFQDV